MRRVCIRSTASGRWILSCRWGAGLPVLAFAGAGGGHQAGQPRAGVFQAEAGGHPQDPL